MGTDGWFRGDGGDGGLRFRDRRDAGRALLARLESAYGGQRDLRVLALPRGGVPVAYEVAVGLGAPLDVFIVRKLGVPGHEELAMGAIASGGVRVLNEEVVARLRLKDELIAKVTEREARELERRERLYRPSGGELDVKGKTLIVVDDGLATGATLRAAVLALRRLGAARIVAAVPVASDETCEEFRQIADEIVCALTPEPFFAVGQAYEDFTQTSDDEVRNLLESARARLESGGAPARSRAPLSSSVFPSSAGSVPPAPRPVEIPVGSSRLLGDLAEIPGARGVVVFAHGSGSGRGSPRNRQVAAELQRAGLSTLLVDLLTPEEARLDEESGELRFNIPLLASRLVEAIGWAAGEPGLSGRSIGIFGASTGAAAALIAASERPELVRAVVSRGGRPDLAMGALPRVQAPTLFIVGGMDIEVLRMNHRALAVLQVEKRLQVIPGAGHLFEERGAMNRVAEMSAAFFTEQLGEGGGLPLRRTGS